MAWYNDNDSAVVPWLRELIARDLIAPGAVDARSIVDVQPADVSAEQQCHFFAGIGGWSLALRMAGVPDDEPIWTASPPCQPLSGAGADVAMSTNGTSGPLFTHSSPSTGLQRSLANKLRAAMDVNGSPEFVLTWREWD